MQQSAVPRCATCNGSRLGSPRAACTQAVAVGDQDHGRVAMPIAAVLARAVHQPLDLVLGEVAPLDCQV